MTKVKKCRNASPRLLDRIIMWFGINIELHNWQMYRKRNKYIIYYCRKCDCGADEVRNAGPSGDNKWRDIAEPFRWSWEKTSFDKANILDT